MEPFCLILVDGYLTISVKDKQLRLFVTPALPVHALPHKIKVGDHLELRRPDGSRQPTIMAGIEHARHLDGKSSWPLALPSAITAADVPVGTEIWWIAEGTTRTKP